MVAGDLVHLLAELLDNALRYSPPISQVRVSAVHTGNGGLVIEVSDVGLGMTDSDLRVANTRLQSGGEVNPYTARHMGLFVVGRLAAQHGLVVRLRSTVAGDPNSGTTAGVYVPPNCCCAVGSRVTPDTRRTYGVPADTHARATRPAPTFDDGASRIRAASRAPAAPEYRNGHVDIPVSLLPQRNPGASGHLGRSVGASPSPSPEPEPELGGRGRVAGRLDARADRGVDARTRRSPSGPSGPTDTSAFFAARGAQP